MKIGSSERVDKLSPVVQETKVKTGESSRRNRFVIAGFVLASLKGRTGMLRDLICGRIGSAGCARVPEGGTGDLRSEVRWSLEAAGVGEEARIPEFYRS